MESVVCDTKPEINQAKRGSATGSHERNGGSTARPQRSNKAVARVTCTRLRLPAHSITLTCTRPRGTGNGAADYLRAATIACTRHAGRATTLRPTRTRTSEASWRTGVRRARAWPGEPAAERRNEPRHRSGLNSQRDRAAEHGTCAEQRDRDRDGNMASSFIAWYLFLAGAGAGSFFIGGIVDLAIRFKSTPWLIRISPVTDAGLVVGPIFVALSSVFLLLDLGAPEKALLVFLRPSLSVIGIGAWSIFLFCACSAVAFAIGRFSNRALQRFIEPPLQCLSVILSLCIMVYSGVYYALFPSVPFLHVPWIPILFFSSALTTGMALLVLVGFIRSSSEGVLDALSGLSTIDIALILVEIMVIIGFFLQSSTTSDVTALSLQSLLNGTFSGVFWLGVIGLGCLAPLLIDITSIHNTRAPLLAVGACSTLAGGLCLRFVLLLAATRYTMVDMSIQTFWM